MFKYEINKRKRVVKKENRKQWDLMFKNIILLDKVNFLKEEIEFKFNTKNAIKLIFLIE